MKTYTIKIMNGKELIHRANHLFDDVLQAQNYANGIVCGLQLAGSQATGIRIKENKI